jgi:hypothetical protein
MERIDYWYWNNVFSSEQIKKLNEVIDNNFHQFEPENLGAKLDGKNLKTSTVKLIYYVHVKNFFNNFTDDYTDIVNRKFGYDIFPMRNPDVLHHNIYSSKNYSKYDFHIDAATNQNLDIKLTMLVNLSNEPYEGGEFEIFNTRPYEVKELKPPGNVIMFKSYLNHRVLPVTKGERRTLALFLTGHRFR